MWSILLYVAIFALFFRFCIKPLHNKYKHAPDEEYKPIDALRCELEAEDDIINFDNRH